MKHRFYIMSALLVAVALLNGCDDDATEGVSKVTFYPEIALKGEQWNSIPQGGSWTDPGVVATEGGAEIPVVVGGDVVNPNVPGAYTIQYTATNKDGFPTTEYRYVGVISAAAAAVDLTGDYQRNAGVGGIAKVSKVDGVLNLYTSNNVGGTATADRGAATTVKFYYFDTGKLAVPYQLVQGSPFYATGATVKEGISYTWTVINPGYGTAARTFVKL